MSGMYGAGPAWRNLRADRSVVDNHISGRTVRRVLAFARPHRRLISFFLLLTVVDASTVVVTPLLVQRVVDDGPPVAVSYQLTEAGASLRPVLEQLADWARESLPERECTGDC